LIPTLPELAPVLVMVVAALGDQPLAPAAGAADAASRRPSPRRLLVLTTPGGLDGFCRELATAAAAGTLGPQAYASASANHGITWSDQPP
jgi:hypothetical protein